MRFRPFWPLTRRHPSTAEELAKAQEERAKKAAERSTKPFRLKDYERELILQGGDVDADEPAPPPRVKTFADEQAELKRAFKESLEQVEDDDDEAEGDGDELSGGIFKRRQRTSDEQEAEERDYLAFLKAEDAKEKSKQVDEMQTLRRFWTDPSLDEGERFLRECALPAARPSLMQRTHSAAPHRLTRTLSFPLIRVQSPPSIAAYCTAAIS